METNKFIKLHQFNNNTPIVINVDSIVLVQQDEDDKSTCITLETENVDVLDHGVVVHVNLGDDTGDLGTYLNLLDGFDGTGGGDAAGDGGRFEGRDLIDKHLLVLFLQKQEQGDPDDEGRDDDPKDGFG